MTTKTSHSTEELQSMVASALQAYELAQAIRLRIGRQDQTALHPSTLESQEQTALAQVEPGYTGEEMETSLEEGCVEHLSVAIEQVEKTSRELLMQLDKSSSRSGGEVVTTAFFTVQLTYIDMRTSMLKLAMLLMDTTRWEEARRVVQPLLEDEKVPLYTDAYSLFYESYYRSVESALSKGDLVRVVSDLRQLVKVNYSYKETPQLLEEVIAQLSNKAMWKLAVQLIVAVEDISVVNNLVLEGLDNRKEVQAAMATIRDTKLLWSTNLTLLPGISNVSSMSPGISHLTFSSNSQLIAFDYSGSIYSSGSYYYSGVMVLDTQSASVVTAFKHQSGEKSQNPIISLSFDTQDQFLQIQTQSNNQISLDLATGLAQQSQISEAQAVSRPSQQVNGLVLDQIRKKTKEIPTIWAASYNGFYVAVSDGKMNLYMFRKSASFE